MRKSGPTSKTFESIFVVDVEMKASEGKPALYRILTVKDAFERS